MTLSHIIWLYHSLYMHDGPVGAFVGRNVGSGVGACVGSVCVCVCVWVYVCIVPFHAMCWLLFCKRDTASSNTQNRNLKKKAAPVILVSGCNQTCVPEINVTLNGFVGPKVGEFKTDWKLVSHIVSTNVLLSQHTLFVQFKTMPNSNCVADSIVWFFILFFVFALFHWYFWLY